MISERVLQARMAEVGRIKIGGLEENVRTTTSGQKWQAPTKFDHFVITGMDRDAKNNFTRDEVIHSIIGQQPKELKIRLMYNDIELNFKTELALYQGKTCVCRGNGEVAHRLDKDTGELIETACPCPKLEQEKNGCKPHGVLHCLIEQAMQCGGVYKFATTSWNTIRGIISSLKFISACTGGKIAGLPLTMKYMKKATQTKTGTATTIPVVVIVYEGNPVQMLDSAIQTEKQRLQAGIYLETLEQQVRREMKNAETIAGPLDEDEVPEFHPEEENDTAAPAAPAKTIGQAIAEARETEGKATEGAEAPKTESGKTTKAKITKPATQATATTTTTAEAPKKYHCTACGRTSDSPGTCKCNEGKTQASTAAETKSTAPAAAPTTTIPETTQPTAQATAGSILARGEMMKEITSTRAQKRSLTADWQNLPLIHI